LATSFAMTSAIVYMSDSPSAPGLLADLEAIGVRVLAMAQTCDKLVHDVNFYAPDVLICADADPAAHLLAALQTVATSAPCPLLVFTSDSDAANITRAAEIGVHAYVVQGYGPQRLTSLIHLAMARFTAAQAVQAELLAVSTRLAERKMVDRAKGILMRARQLSDDDAFQILRTASMHSNQRLGQVSQQIIHSARFAEDVNRSGQLRMLSQRLVKLALLQAAGVQVEASQERLQDSVSRVDASLQALAKNLAQPPLIDLLAQVTSTWAQLKLALPAGEQKGVTKRLPKNKLLKIDLPQLDALAEQWLQEAERLTAGLENAGAVPPLKMLNLAGRQRMLSQRFAKYALLEALGDSVSRPHHAALRAEAQTAFEQGLQYLNALPLSSQAIRAALNTAGLCWASMLAATAQTSGAADQARLARLTSLAHLAEASEELLGVFESLSAHYESSLQMLIG
jgi:AmiR/NasT family two-component response regulator